MSSEKRRQLGARIVASQEFRDSLTDAEIVNRISFQLKSMQEDRGWTQQELAERAGIAQPLISKYFGGYERYSLQTLKKLASAFDVTLVVGFAPFSDLVDWIIGLTPEKIAVPPVDRDARLRAADRYDATVVVLNAGDAPLGYANSFPEWGGTFFGNIIPMPQPRPSVSVARDTPVVTVKG